jgi:hypothetical protein
MSVGLLLLLAACIDYAPKGVVAGTAPEASIEAPREGTRGGRSAVLAGVFPPAEVCNGLDDDADGEVDEGFADTDHDGVVDCMDSECEADGYKALPLDDPYACTPGGGVTVTGEIGLQELWGYRDEMEDNHAGCASLVAADLEGDGSVELVCGETYGQLLVFDAMTGSLLTSFGDAEGAYGVAVLDADGDGALEVYSSDRYGGYHGYDAITGAEVWTSVVPPSGLAPRDIGDLGVVVRLSSHGQEPALVGKEAAASLHDGTAVTSLTFDHDGKVAPFAADIDLDGEIDLLMAGYRFDEDGNVVFAPAERPHQNAHYTQVIQADADEEGEVLFTNSDGWSLVDTDGTELGDGLWPSAVNVWSGPPCTTSDADGTRFFVAQAYPWVESRSVSGAVRWTVEVRDSSEYEGCVAFDFTGDGHDDVAFQDEEVLRIVDGVTGAVVASAPAPSVTANEGLMVVDLEGDGTVELVWHSYSDTARDGANVDVVLETHAIKVFRVTGITADIANHWPLESWTGTELNPDLTIPRTQRPSWLTTCAGPAQPEIRLWGSDLVPSVVDACTAGCENGPVTLALGVENWGPLELETGTTVAVYRESDRLLLGVAVLPDWVDDATVSAGFPLTVPLADAQEGLLLVAGDDGSGLLSADDPDTSNNTVSWRFNRCD